MQHKKKNKTKVTRNKEFDKKAKQIITRNKESKKVVLPAISTEKTKKKSHKEKSFLITVTLPNLFFSFSSLKITLVK